MVEFVDIMVRAVLEAPASAWLTFALAAVAGWRYPRLCIALVVLALAPIGARLELSPEACATVVGARVGTLFLTPRRRAGGGAHDLAPASVVGRRAAPPRPGHATAIM